MYFIFYIRVSMLFMCTNCALDDFNDSITLSIGTTDLITAITLLMLVYAIASLMYTSIDLEVHDPIGVMI
jgi:hypothetical protein